VHDRDDDRPLSAEAQAILRHATIADLRSVADEPAALIAARERPIPELPDDAEKRASRLLVLLQQSRDRERQWQKLCFPDICLDRDEGKAIQHGRTHQ
jgi:hypothetical protein